MLGYRHAFHAGNPADVLKHSALIFCLEYLTRKETPLLCVDTHAGRGIYRLDEGFAAKNREWERGAGRLRRFQGALPALLESWRKCAGADIPASGSVVPPAAENGAVLQAVENGAAVPASGGAASPAADDGALWYPGSPEIFRRLLREQDRACCFELHPADFAALEERFRHDRRFRIRRQDGFEGLIALLPPPSRRGLILIDPSYEMKEDFGRLPECLSAALRRFSTGTCLIWYPLLADYPESLRLPERLMGLYGGNRLRVEVRTGPVRPEGGGPSPGQGGRSPRGMFGSGLVICNPPWTLGPALKEALPFLAEGPEGGERGWKIWTET
ncbi:MAG: 23S rRNA (adenine(2030)-N(6))-methyltransferase RlmJ [Treponema sp.]|jgi:23S rRNA (adenine2030-N6)-methyltransferase|nr:23S rRNA (adenine(2030)-N(6))-methyltransferase RlmJ [Treponema sp.]